MVEVIYASDNYLIVNKPFDMYINSNDTNEENTLQRKLSSEYSRLHFTHRLDYATSGAICLALTKMAAAAAGKHFEKRTAEKYYIAVVRGHVSFEMAELNLPIGYDEDHLDGNKKMCTNVQNVKCLNPKSAQTRMIVISRGSYDGDPVTKVLLKPLTGRRHQLRVHCSAIGHTILGDYTYSNRQDSKPHRMFLHALRLKLPIENEPIDVSTEDPFSNDSEFIKYWQILTTEKVQLSWDELFKKLNTAKPEKLLKI